MASAEGSYGFGASAGFTVGVEEELLVVDPGTHALADSAPLLRALAADRSEARHDIYTAQLELSSAPSRSAEEAVAALAALRRRAREAGGRLLGAGLHPAAPFGDAHVVEDERYMHEKERLGGVLLRTPDCALHVHVAMPDFATAIRAFNGMREWLPLLHALGANSAFWHGRDARLASARMVYRRGFPRVEVPPPFRDEDDWRRLVDEYCAVAEVADYTFVWWDLRPHPKLGTLELRVMDAQAPLERVAALSALAHGLAVHEAAAPEREWMSREAVGESLYRATRAGTRATLWTGTRHEPVAVVAERALELARRALAGLGADAALEGVERIVREGSGDALQRAWYSEGGIDAVVDNLVRETARG